MGDIVRVASGIEVLMSGIRDRICAGNGCFNRSQVGARKEPQSAGKDLLLEPRGQVYRCMYVKPEGVIDRYDRSVCRGA